MKILCFDSVLHFFLMLAGMKYAASANNSTLLRNKSSLEIFTRRGGGSRCQVGQYQPALTYGCPVYYCDQCYAGDGLIFTYDFTGRGSYSGCLEGCPGCVCWDCAACYACMPGTYSSIEESTSCDPCPAGSFAG